MPGLYDAVADLLSGDEDIKEIGPPVFVDAHSASRIALGVTVDQERLFPEIAHRRAQVHSRGRLADPALLVGHCNYLRHTRLLNKNK